MKKVLVLLALLAAVCGLLTFSAAAESAAASGICGENLTWTLDAAGTLTVSGTGAMEDYNYLGAPWYQSRDSIKAVVVESGVTAIGERAFNGCSSLTSITIPEGVTAIGHSAFSGCSSLSSITIPEGVTTIGRMAFFGCSSLSSITIPEGVTAIDIDAFYCSGLKDVSITDLDAWRRIDFANFYATPMCNGGNLLLNGQKLVSVTVPEGVTEVKAYTFYGFKDLIQVTLPAGVTTIGEYAFSRCSSLTSITIPESVTTIGDSAFRFCDSLTDVSITDLAAWCRIDFADSSATPVCNGGNLLLNGQKLVSVTVPEGVTEVKAYTFCGFKNLIQVTLPEGVTAIGDGAFSGCTGLSSITLPEGVTTIGEAAFLRCSSLSSITIPESVTAIGIHAFDGCSSLTSINIPEGVTAIGEYAFCDCTSLSSIEIPEGVTVIQLNVFRGASGIQRVALSKNLKGVLGNAFDGCTNLKEVFYAGSEAEWNALPIATGNDPLKNATIYFNSTIDDYYCRITVVASEGGRVAVSANTAKAGDTVTVTATPYRGYVMSAIYVDGAEISGDTFTVTGNHRVSAVFTRLPAVGGNEDFRLEGITVLDGAGNPLQELPAERLLVTVTVRHLKESGSGAVMLAQYDERGRYQGLLWLTLEEMPQGMTLKVTLPVDNTGGSIAQLKVFLVESLFSPAPVGEAISFGTI